MPNVRPFPAMHPPSVTYTKYLIMRHADEVSHTWTSAHRIGTPSTVKKLSHHAALSRGDFNATLEMPSAQLMASVFRPTKTAPTAFTPLQDTDGSVSHPYWPRFDRCIDYIWVAGPLILHASGVCFDTPSATDPTLWPSDHAGVWADLSFV